MIRAHLLRWRPRQPAQRTESTPRRLPSGAASQLGPSHRSGRGFSDRLLVSDEAVFVPLRQLGGMIRAGVVSPVQLAETFLHRLETLGPRYNAVITVTRERALREAARRTGAQGRARPRPAARHSLRGQGLLAPGHPHDVGREPSRTGHRPRRDGHRRAAGGRRGAGAPSSAWSSWPAGWATAGQRLVHRAGAGPVEPDDWSGGSSCGSGAAVGGGAGPVRHRVGDVGLDHHARRLLRHDRPAAHYGRVSRHGAMALCWTLDKIGPLGHTADDCGLVLAAIAGPDPDDPAASERPATPIRRPTFPAVRGSWRSWGRRSPGARPRSGRTSRRRWRCFGRWAPSRRSSCRTCPSRRGPRDPRRRGGRRLRGPGGDGGRLRADGAGGSLHGVRARRHPREGLHEGAAAAPCDGARGRSPCSARFDALVAPGPPDRRAAARPRLQERARRIGPRRHGRRGQRRRPARGDACPTASATAACRRASS